MRPIDLILHELASIKRADRRRFLGALDELKAAPLRGGDFHQLDSIGRIHEVVLLGDWLVTCWIYHAVAEILVVVIERAEH